VPDATVPSWQQQPFAAAALPALTDSSLHLLADPAPMLSSIGPRIHVPSSVSVAACSSLHLTPSSVPPPFAAVSYSAAGSGVRPPTGVPPPPAIRPSPAVPPPVSGVPAPSGVPPPVSGIPPPVGGIPRPPAGIPPCPAVRPLVGGVQPPASVLPCAGVPPPPRGAGVLLAGVLPPVSGVPAPSGVPLPVSSVPAITPLFTAVRPPVGLPVAAGAPMSVGVVRGAAADTLHAGVSTAPVGVASSGVNSTLLPPRFMAGFDPTVPPPAFVPPVVSTVIPPMNKVSLSRATEDMDLDNSGSSDDDLGEGFDEEWPICSRRTSGQSQRHSHITPFVRQEHGFQLKESTESFSSSLHSSEIGSQQYKEPVHSSDYFKLGFQQANSSDNYGMSSPVSGNNFLMSSAPFDHINSRPIPSTAAGGVAAATGSTDSLRYGGSMPAGMLRNPVSVNSTRVPAVTGPSDVDFRTHSYGGNVVLPLSTLPLPPLPRCPLDAQRLPASIADNSSFSSIQTGPVQRPDVVVRAPNVNLMPNAAFEPATLRPPGQRPRMLTAVRSPAPAAGQMLDGFGNVRVPGNMDGSTQPLVASHIGSMRAPAAFGEIALNSARFNMDCDSVRSQAPLASSFPLGVNKNPMNSALQSHPPVHSQLGVRSVLGQFSEAAVEQVVSLPGPTERLLRLAGMQTNQLPHSVATRFTGSHLERLNSGVEPPKVLGLNTSVFGAEAHIGGLGSPPLRRLLPQHNETDRLLPSLPRAGLPAPPRLTSVLPHLPLSGW